MENLAIYVSEEKSTKVNWQILTEKKVMQIYGIITNGAEAECKGRMV